jgi:hypothetical protein
MLFLLFILDISNEPNNNKYSAVLYFYVFYFDWQL